MRYKGYDCVAISSVCGIDDEVSLALRREYNQAELYKQVVKGVPIATSKGSHNIGKKEKFFYNVVSSFDIEFSSTHTSSGERIGVMYHWQWLIGSTIFTGRDWESYLLFANEVSRVFYLAYNVVLHVFVHNLSCEFQFLRTKFYFAPEDVFVRSRRDVLNCLSADGFYFRDSYAVSDESLEKTAEMIHLDGVKKLSYDYNKVRTPATPITRDEYEYCVNDVYIVAKYIESLLVKYSFVVYIPVTLTSMARSDLRSAMRGNRGRAFKKLIKSLHTSDLDEYHMQNFALHGGFVYSKYHDNGDIDGYSDIEYDVHSRDAMSFYPSQLVLRKFPIGTSKTYDGVQWDAMRSLFAGDDTKFVIAHFRLYDVSAKYNNFLVMQENHISPRPPQDGGYNDDIEERRCISRKKRIIRHGRIFAAEKIGICCSLQDMLIYERYYNIGAVEVDKAIVYDCDFLPTIYVRYILKLFKDKESAPTDYEREYSKQILNSLAFGVNAMNPCRDEYEYSESDSTWVRSSHNYEKELGSYNRSHDVTAFILSVVLTAYARMELFSLASQMLTEDIVYIDTDGIKYTGDYEEIFEKYNRAHAKYVQDVAMYVHRLPHQLFWSDKKRGYIGSFMREKDITRMRTLGPKKYIMEVDGKTTVKMSGLPKSGQKYYNFSNFRCDPDFRRDIVIGGETVNVHGSTLTAEESHKVMSVYITRPVSGVVIDYRGQEFEAKEDSCIYMEDVPFCLCDMSRTIIDALLTRDGGSNNV